MIPILYEKNETEFTSNGLCRLRDCTKCEVVEERNSIYECDFDYPVDGINFEQIRLGRIIAVEHDDTDDIQPFDIVSYTKPINGVVSFHAVHISYRQSKIVTSGQNVTTLEAAFAMLKSGLPSNPFTYWSDQFSTATFPLADNIPRSVRECLGGTEGSILDTYGGEYEWDKFTVKLWNSRGSDVDFVIRYGLNMTEYNDETDSSESYSAIIPYWVGQDANNNQIVVKGALQTYGTTVSGRVDAVAMDFSQDFESDVQPTAAQLEALARQKLADNQPQLAAQTIKVGFARLQDTGEYGQFQNLLKCKLCDTVRVEFPRYNMSGRFKIVKTAYDVLLDRFTSMELGTLQTTLSEALGISSGSSSYSTTGGGR
jgi:phage minor structural protein